MVKILYVINKSTDGGVVSTTRNRINAFISRGFEAEVFFLARGDGAKMFREIPHYYIENTSHFQQMVEKGGYDCIIFVYSLDYLKYLPNNYHGKKIYELRGWSQGVVKQLKKKNISKSVDAIVCIAKYLEPLVKPYFRGDVPIFIDGNTVDPIFHYLNASKRNWSESPNPIKGHSVIAFVGRVEGLKNWREFVEIYRILEKKYPVEAWFLSNPKSSNSIANLHKLCSTHRLKYKVIHVFNENMPEIYSIIADSGGCVLSTSLREGLGNSLLEPMACKCPVVSSDSPGKNEVIINEQNGMLYKLGDINMGVSCIEKILKDTPLRKKIIQNALSTIQYDYHPNVYVDRYVDILSKI